ncbi:MAG: DUF3311 domain-containing protein [Bryobacterales bacterium]|nr:DUF3311 domain-containing protein [Acidobacteriota bacterium]MCB9385513.1 DUF3311 domain-containing protein [Bryobacterales bacterium]
MRKLIYALAIVLFLLHQDWWLWDDPTLVVGFLPVGLAYHLVYSLVSALLWFLAVRFAWPADDLDDFADRP